MSCRQRCLGEASLLRDTTSLSLKNHPGQMYTAHDAVGDLCVDPIITLWFILFFSTINSFPINVMA